MSVMLPSHRQLRRHGARPKRPVQQQAPPAGRTVVKAAGSGGVMASLGAGVVGSWGGGQAAALAWQ